MRALAISLLLLVAESAERGVRPTSAALRRTYETNRQSIVEVIGPKRSGIGIIVGAGGEVLTSVEYVGLNEAKVKFQGRELPAHVSMANAHLKVALVEISAPGSFPSAAVKIQDELTSGSWVLGILRPESRKPSVLIGSVLRANDEHTPFAETDLRIPPGSPVFDAQGRMVALAVQRRGRGGAMILPLSKIKAQLTALQP